MNLGTCLYDTSHTQALIHIQMPCAQAPLLSKRVPSHTGILTHTTSHACSCSLAGVPRHLDGWLLHPKTEKQTSATLFFSPDLNKKQQK